MKTLSDQEIREELKNLDGWKLEKNAIHSSFKFKDFKEAFTAMTRIAFEAEAQQHHPDWENGYNQLKISLTTHDANGVTQKDFKLAQSIEKIVKGKAKAS